VAAFVILTEPFREMVDGILAFQQTDRPLPVIVLDHPTQNLPQEKVRERARQLADAAERLLNGEAPQ
jgi:hypothetical protein